MTISLPTPICVAGAAEKAKEAEIGGPNGELDAIVVGAGAPGLAAGGRLLEAGAAVLVLEARDRIGGRALTRPTRLGRGVDLGCEWLHSADRNPWTAIARAQGFSIDERLPDSSSRIARSRGAAAQAEWTAVYADFAERVDAAAEAPEDRPAPGVTSCGRMAGR